MNMIKIKIDDRNFHYFTWNFYKIYVVYVIFLKAIYAYKDPNINNGRGNNYNYFFLV